MNLKKGLLILGLSASAAALAACGKKEDVKTTEAVVETTTAVETVENTAVKESIAAEVKEKMTMEEMIAKTILEENNGKYAEGECKAEAHEILDYKENETNKKIYTLTMYGEYEFQNDNFVKCSGSGIIPIVFEFEKNEDGTLTLISMEEPEDGEGYTDSIKNMFPEEYHEICISPTEEIIERMTKMERYYANEYLKEIGRKAEIGNYADFEYTLLTDEGVSVDVSNKMLEYEKEMGPYPMWLGTVEKIEEDVRYVYSRSLDKENKKIIFEKKNYETEELVESFIYDSETGDEAKN